MANRRERRSLFEEVRRRHIDDPEDGLAVWLQLAALVVPRARGLCAISADGIELHAVASSWPSWVCFTRRMWRYWYTCLFGVRDRFIAFYCFIEGSNHISLAYLSLITRHARAKHPVAVDLPWPNS